jgi:serine/threonine protein kinase
MFKCGACSYVILDNTDKVSKYTTMSDCYWMRDLEISKMVSNANQKGLLGCNSYDFVEAVNILDYKKKHNLDSSQIEARLLKGDYCGEKEMMCKMNLEKLDYTLNEKHVFDDATLLQYIADVVSGLSFLHQYDIVHRDIRRPNIMIKNKRAVLIDYSHAYKLNQIPPIQDSKYTIDHNVYAPQVRAPEVYNYIDNGRVLYGKPADIWALGITIFELIIQDYIEDILCMPQVRNMRSMYKNNNFRDIVKTYIGESKLVELPFYTELLNGCLHPDPTSRFTINDVAMKIRTMQFKYSLDIYDMKTSCSSVSNVSSVNNEITDKTSNTLFNYYSNDVLFNQTPATLEAAKEIFKHIRGKPDPTAIAVGMYLDVYLRDKIDFISDIESCNEPELIEELIRLHPVIRSILKWG